jgi:hypothetical protein
MATGLYGGEHCIGHVRGGLAQADRCNVDHADSTGVISGDYPRLYPTCTSIARSIWSLPLCAQATVSLYYFWYTFQYSPTNNALH